MTYSRSYFTGSNDAILNDVGLTMAVSLVGTHHGLGGASKHSFATPPHGPTGQLESWGLDQYDKP
jgi:hypothetical protein